MLVKAFNSDLMVHFEKFTEIALKAQNQSRQTLSAISELKHPRRTIEEAEKFVHFIDHQRNLIKSAEWQKQSEIDEAERKKYWDERLKET